MAIKGITYDNQGPAAADHGEFWRRGFSDGILSGCEISYLGADVTISAGRIVSAGRLSRLSAAETIAIGATEGVARIVYQTDLSQAASRTEFKQLSFVVQIASSVDALPELIQEDINNGGIVYQMEFCKLQLGGPGVSSIISKVPEATLPASSLYSPMRVIGTVHALTAADMGKTLRNSYNIASVINITAENSANIPVGAEFAIITYGTAADLVRINFSSLQAIVSCESAIYASGASVIIPDGFGMIAIKKVNNETATAPDVWFVTGSVEVVT